MRLPLRPFIQLQAITASCTLKQTAKEATSSGGNPEPLLEQMQGHGPEIGKKRLLKRKQLV